METIRAGAVVPGGVVLVSAVSRYRGGGYGVGASEANVSGAVVLGAAMR